MLGGLGQCGVMMPSGRGGGEEGEEALAQASKGANNIHASTFECILIAFLALSPFLACGCLCFVVCFEAVRRAACCPTSHHIDDRSFSVQRLRSSEKKTRHPQPPLFRTTCACTFLPPFSATTQQTQTHQHSARPCLINHGSTPWRTSPPG